MNSTLRHALRTQTHTHNTYIPVEPNSPVVAGAGAPNPPVEGAALLPKAGAVDVWPKPPPDPNGVLAGAPNMLTVVDVVVAALGSIYSIQ